MCPSVGRVTCLAPTLSSESFSDFDGHSDFLVGSAGCIAASCQRLLKMTNRIYDPFTSGKIIEAPEVHRIAAQAGSSSKAALAATKYGTATSSNRAAGHYSGIATAAESIRRCLKIVKKAI